MKQNINNDVMKDSPIAGISDNTSGHISVTIVHRMRYARSISVAQSPNNLRIVLNKKEINSRGPLSTTVVRPQLWTAS